MNGNLFKSYICMGKKVNLLYSKKMNCYIIEVDDKMVKTFPFQTTTKFMEDYAMKLLIQLTDKKD